MATAHDRGYENETKIKNTLTRHDVPDHLYPSVANPNQSPTNDIDIRGHHVEWKGAP